MKDLSVEFQTKGFIGPFRYCEAGKAASLAEALSRFPRHFLPWEKGKHVVSNDALEIAESLDVLEKVDLLLGKNILLSGSQLIIQGPGMVHKWHSDLEHLEWEGVTLWMGLKNVSQTECMNVISGSHVFDVTPQQLGIEGVDLANDEAILAAAKSISSKSELVPIDIKEGEFFIFHGKLWHGTKNLTKGDRTALILQYTTPDQRIKIVEDVSYPKITWRSLKPKCVLLRGIDNYNYNTKILRSDIGSIKMKLISMFYYAPQCWIIKIKRMLKRKTS